jgi:hypothetical protein
MKFKVKKYIKTTLLKIQLISMQTKNINIIQILTMHNKKEKNCIEINQVSKSMIMNF